MPSETTRRVYAKLGQITRKVQDLGTQRETLVARIEADTAALVAIDAWIDATVATVNGPPAPARAGAPAVAVATATPRRRGRPRLTLDVSAPHGRNPKTGLPYKFSAETRRQMSERQRARVAAIAATTELNPRTGEPYRATPEMRANMARGQRRRQRLRRKQQQGTND